MVCVNRVPPRWAPLMQGRRCEALPDLSGGGAAPYTMPRSLGVLANHSVQMLAWRGGGAVSKA